MNILYWIAFPFAWLIDLMSYTAHLDMFRHVPPERYEPYNFSMDLVPKLKKWKRG